VQALSGDAVAALNSGYHVAFLFGAIFAAVAGVVGGIMLRTGRATVQGGGDDQALAAANGHSNGSGNKPATENY
jgi:hypothetical protein